MVADFKSTLSNLSKRILDKRSGGYPHTEQPLVIIVDEIDRCRPPFAIELLEKIKHFFETQNVVFLLVINRKELESAVKSVYGSENSGRFLDKFINFSTSLPYNYNRDKEREAVPVDCFIADLYEYHEFDGAGLGRSYCWGECNSSKEKVIEHHIHIIQEWARRLNLSLRQIQQVFVNLSLFSKIINETEPCFEWLLFIASLKVYDRDLFKKLADNHIEYNDIYNKFNFSDIEIVTKDKNGELGKTLDLAGLMKLGIKLSIDEDGGAPSIYTKIENSPLVNAILYYSRFLKADPKSFIICGKGVCIKESPKADRIPKMVEYARLLERFDL